MLLPARLSAETAEQLAEVVNNRTYAVGAQTGRLRPIQAGFACGSMVRYGAFSQKCCTKCNIFVKKLVLFRPAGGEMFFRVRDRVT